MQLSPPDFAGCRHNSATESVLSQWHGDVADHVAHAVLARGLAQIGANPPQDRRGIFGAVALDRHAADQYEAAAVLDLAQHFGESRGETVE